MIQLTCTFKVYNLLCHQILYVVILQINRKIIIGDHSALKLVILFPVTSIYLYSFVMTTEQNVCYFDSLKVKEEKLYSKMLIFSCSLSQLVSCSQIMALVVS